MKRRPFGRAVKFLSGIQAMQKVLIVHDIKFVYISCIRVIRVLSPFEIDSIISAKNWEQTKKAR